MLGDENGVVFHWRLLSIIFGIGRGKTFYDKIARLRFDNINAATSQIFGFFFTKFKPASKSRFGKCGKQFFQISHSY